jgi:hypothetical protein
MSVPRPLLLALLGAMLTCATFFAMRNAADTVKAKDEPTQAAIVPATPPKAHKPAPGRANPSGKHAPAPAKAGPTSPPKVQAAKPAKPRPRVKPFSGVPPKVSRALQAKHTVVLFFRQPGADDDATSSAVSSLRGRKKVSVFKDGIAHLARYRSIVADLGITQAPAVVIVGRDRKAQLVEGFIDEGTLNQQVVDAR